MRLAVSYAEMCESTCCLKLRGECPNPNQCKAASTLTCHSVIPASLALKGGRQQRCAFWSFQGSDHLRITHTFAVGGIYTVIKTKAPVTCAEYGDRYCMIGPLSYKSAPMEVEALEPSSPELKESLESMQSRGVKLLYGRWLIEGGPRVLLFDTASVANRLDEWKSDLWTSAGIPTPPGDSETNETVLFGYLVAWFLGEFSARERTRAIVAHFHEWLAGCAIPLVRTLAYAP